MTATHSIATVIHQLKAEIPSGVKLIAVSKTKPTSAIQEAYDAGQRIFGENYVQELSEKHDQLPNDIEWHFIGHLQSNKVKYIAPFVSWIHAVESIKLLSEIDKQAKKNKRTIQCLLQVHIAKEESKFGFDVNEVIAFCKETNFSDYTNIRIRGLMGMASFTDDVEAVRSEFQILHSTFIQLKSTFFNAQENFSEISMGMSGDWKLAIQEGSTMVRIGSAIFGAR